VRFLYNWPLDNSGVPESESSLDLLDGNIDRARMFQPALSLTLPHPVSCDIAVYVTQRAKNSIMLLRSLPSSAEARPLALLVLEERLSC
jgi:hypothetical protein